MTEQVLPCGRDAADLVALVADGRSADPALAAHAAGCPHCTAELAALDGQWELVRAAAAQRPSTPDGLAGRALAAVRGVRGRGGSFDLAQPGGLLRVSEGAVALLARAAAARVLAEHGGGHVRMVRAGGGTVDIGLAVRFGDAIAPLVAHVRAALRSHLAEHLGDSVPAVNVEVVDVIYPPTG